MYVRKREQNRNKNVKNACDTFNYAKFLARHARFYGKPRGKGGIATTNSGETSNRVLETRLTHTLFKKTSGGKLGFEKTSHAGVMFVRKLARKARF